MAYPDTSDDTKTPYFLPFPGRGSLADVPADFKALAEKIEEMLDRKLQKTDWTDRNNQTVRGTDYLYQPKVRIMTQAPDSSVAGVEGDIIFVVP